MIRSKLLGQYRLEPMISDSGDEIFLRINIYERLNQAGVEATVERLEMLTLKPLGSKDEIHAEVWVADDFGNCLLHDIEAQTESELLKEFEKRMKEHLNG